MFILVQPVLGSVDIKVVRKIVVGRKVARCIAILKKEAETDFLTSEKQNWCYK
jgi:hypothetical protein